MSGIGAENDRECPICFLRYCSATDGSSSTDPVLLTCCGHSICLSCSTQASVDVTDDVTDDAIELTGLSTQSSVDVTDMTPLTTTTTTTTAAATPSNPTASRTPRSCSAAPRETRGKGSGRVAPSARLAAPRFLTARCLATGL